MYMQKGVRTVRNDYVQQSGRTSSAAIVEISEQLTTHLKACVFVKSLLGETRANLEGHNYVM